LSSQVLSYFLRNPRAADSLEGVARWRLLDEAIRHRVTATHDALVWLVERGLLRQMEGPGLEPIFSLNPAKAEDAKQLLAKLATPAERRPRGTGDPR
jgi:hypothetical protein